jgi:hypothetical protein
MSLHLSKMRYAITLFGLSTFLVMGLFSCDNGTASKLKVPSTKPTKLKNLPAFAPEPEKNNVSLSSSIQAFTACDSLSKMFDKPELYKIAPGEIRKKYANFKRLAGSHSGAGVFLVTPSGDPTRKLVFKTLPAPIIKSEKNLSEVSLSCRLANLSTHNYLSGEQRASMFFPQLFQVGFTNSLDPSAANIIVEKNPVPFIVIEYIDGLSFIDFVEDIDGDAIKKFGYNLDSAPKDFLKGSLFQIVIALLNADKEIAFRHNDLHPGNAIVAKEIISLSTTINGKNFSYQGPLIKIIDFGGGEDKYNPGGLGTQYAHKPLKNREHRLIDHEFAKFGQTAKRFKAILIANLMSLINERDVRNINIFIQAFSLRLRAQGVKNIDYCQTYQECLELIASW